MNDDAKFAKIIRINTIAGSVMLCLLVPTAILLLVGALPWDFGTAVRLAIFGLVPTALLFLTAWIARRDRVDPAGREGRYQQAAVMLAAGVIVVGMVVVVGLIVWGLVG